MKVELTYFKWSGKFYTTGEYETKIVSLFDIWSEVQRMWDKGELPGLTHGTGASITLVEVPEHPHNHPYLLFPNGRNV